MKLKITEEQIKKIQEDNLMDKTDPIDGFIQQGNISGLAHHYAKSDDVNKQGIIDKATAAKGDVFAQRIKLKAQGVMEGEHPDPFPIDEEERKWMEENNVPIPMNSGGYNDSSAEVPLEETTTTNSVGGQYSSKYFLDPSHAKNPPLTFKGGAVIKPNDKSHTQGINSFTVIKGKLKEDIMRMAEENGNVESALITYKNSSESIDPKDTKAIKRAEWIMSNDPDFVKFEIFKGAPEQDFVIFSTDQDRNKQAELNKTKQMQQPIQQESSPIQPEVTSPALVSQEPMIDEDLEQSLTDQANYNKVPKAVIKYANVLNDLIKQCVDADGDPVGVYDNSSTWQQEFIYTIDIIKNRVYIKSFDRTGKEDGYPEIFPNMNKRAWDEWTVNDCIDSIKHLIKNYRRTIKSLPKRQAAIDTEFVDEAPVVQPQMGELETLPNMNSTVQSVDSPVDGLQNDQQILQQEQPENSFSTEDLFEIYQKVCQDTGEDSEHSQKLKNILIEFGDYDNPHIPINSQAIAEFKNVLPDEEPMVDETTTSASSGQYVGPLKHEVQEDNINLEDTYEGEVIDQYEIPAWAVYMVIDNKAVDPSGNRLSGDQIQEITQFLSSALQEHGSSKFGKSDEQPTKEGMVVVNLYAREEGIQEEIDYSDPEYDWKTTQAILYYRNSDQFDRELFTGDIPFSKISQRLRAEYNSKGNVGDEYWISIYEFGKETKRLKWTDGNFEPVQVQSHINEEALNISPAIANLKRIHGETGRITKAEMKRIKDDSIKATEAEGTQFIDNTDGVKSSDSPNAIGIDPTPQQDEVNLIRKGMEDLNYDLEGGKDFQDRFKANIDRDLTTDEVTDQYGHVTPAGKMANVLDTDTGKNILAAVEKRKEDEEEAPMYAKDPQPVKIVKETDEYVIDENEHKEMLAEAQRMKEMMGYKPSKVVSTKGNKTDNSLFKR